MNATTHGQSGVFRACWRAIGIAVPVAALLALTVEAGAESGAANSQKHADEMRRAPSSLWARLSAAKDEEAAATETVIVTPAALKSTKALTTSGEDPVEDPLAASVNDPLEPINRFFFSINDAIDLVVMRPVSFIYRTIVPAPLRQGISNAVDNASAPVTFANNILQGDPEAAKVTLVRFLINSTAGFGGLVDAAAAAGMHGRSEDFGQTLGVWGAGPGPYLVVPVLGPSTVRDGTGRIVDLAFDPLTWILWDKSILERASPTIASAVTTHERLMDEIQAMRETSPDFYASIRDVYLQKRESDIANGAAAVDAVLEPINPQY